MNQDPRIRLKEWASARGLKSQGAIAKALGVTQQAVSDLLTGQSRPSLPLAVAIKSEVGIEPEEWLTEEELTAIATLATSPTLPPPPPEAA